MALRLIFSRQNLRIRRSPASIFFATARRPFSSVPPPLPPPTEQQGHRDLEVGELQGAQFRIEPLRRTGESLETTRARLLCTPHTSFFLFNQESRC